MTTSTEISPNEPDVMPDYVDVKPAAAGEPVSEPVPEPVNAVPPSVSSVEEAHREGECIPNVPDVRPDCVSSEEAARVVAAGEERGAGVDLGGAAMPEAGRSPWMTWYLAATVMVIGVFGVLVFSQAVSALALARTLPEWAQYLLLIPLGVCCLLVLGVCVSVGYAWFRLRAVRQVDVAALEELRARARTREDGVAHYQRAREWLEGYLRRYPLTHEGQAALVRAGVSAERLEALARSRHRLVGLSVDSVSWLEDFRGQFQADLDSAARARVNAWSLKAAGCVIASPLPLLDSLLVLGISLKMVGDLCTIYNVRASRAGSLVLLNRAVVAAFIAGVAEDAMEAGGGVVMDEVAGVLGEGVVGSLGARVAGVVAPKVGEGVVNAYFVRRLGGAVVRMLQPLRPQKGK